jgi:hypothetical protein
MVSPIPRFHASTQFIHQRQRFRSVALFLRSITSPDRDDLSVAFLTDLGHMRSAGWSSSNDFTSSFYILTFSLRQRDRIFCLDCRLILDRFEQTQDEVNHHGVGSRGWHMFTRERATTGLGPVRWYRYCQPPRTLFSMLHEC